MKQFDLGQRILGNNKSDRDSDNKLDEVEPVSNVDCEAAEAKNTLIHFRCR